MGSIARAFAWPLRRFFDPRFDRLRGDLFEHLADLRAEALRLNHDAEVLRREIAETTQDTRRLVETEIDASREATTIIGSSLSELVARVEVLSDEVQRLRDQLSRAPDEIDSAQAPARPRR